MKSIYALVDPRDGLIRYIGASKNPNERFKWHLRDTSQSRKARWLRSLTSSGQCPLLRILVAESQDWQKDEVRLIAEYRSAGFDLTNLTSGGEGLHSPSLETKVKLRAIQIERMKNPSYRAKIFTDERAKKISVALKGRPKSREHVAKLPQNQSGYAVSLERAEQLRDSLRKYGYKHPKGCPMHPNARAALSAILVGNKHTQGRVMPEDERRRRSEALMGRQKTISHREKIAEGQRRAWARRRGEINE